jgi:predicted DsbA family dithiol-disulfide isomerase
MRLQNAMSASSDEFDFKPIDWRPFYLNSTIPAEGYSYKEYFEKKGMTVNDETIASWAARMRPTADELGISFLNGRRMYNTRQSHRLFEWTKKHHPHLMDSILPKVLFEAYFSKGENISDPAVLVNIAEKAGVPDTDAVLAMLKDDTAEPSSATVDAADKHSKRELGVDGVPFFLMNGVPAFSGAQPEATFIKVFRWLKANNKMIPK